MWQLFKFLIFNVRQLSVSSFQNCVFMLIPSIKLYPSKIVLYNQFISDNIYSKNSVINENKIRTKKSNHGDTLSLRSIKKISTIIDYLVFMSKSKNLYDFKGNRYKFKLNFITLTLPSKQLHDDQFLVNNCLNQFLIEIKKKYNVDKYIWRAERQRNGNIHFHIITDKYIFWNDIRTIWNRIINKYDYVNNYSKHMQKYHKKGFRINKKLYEHGWDYSKQYNAYISGKLTNWFNPNTTDVHSIKKVGNLKIYLLKYFTKQYQNENIKCNLWGCSRNLSNLTGVSNELDIQLLNEVNILFDSNKTKVVKNDFATILYFSYVDLYVNRLWALLKLLYNQINSVFKKINVDTSDNLIYNFVSS